MALTSEELTQVWSEYKTKTHVLDHVDASIVHCDAFIRLVVLQSECPKDILSAMGIVLAILEIGITIGRNQATKELLEKI